MSHTGDSKSPGDEENPDPASHRWAGYPTMNWITVSVIFVTMSLIFQFPFESIRECLLLRCLCLCCLSELVVFFECLFFICRISWNGRTYKYKYISKPWSGCNVQFWSSLKTSLTETRFYINQTIKNWRVYNLQSYQSFYLFILLCSCFIIMLSQLLLLQMEEVWVWRLCSSFLLNLIF